MPTPHSAREIAGDEPGSQAGRMAGASGGWIRLAAGVGTARRDVLLASVGAALFALRASLELTPPRPELGGLVAGLCLLLAFLGRRASWSWRPLWLCWVYVVWPRPSPTLALVVAATALIALLVGSFDDWRYPVLRRDLLFDGITLIAGLTTYLATLAPTVLPADSGEFQIVGPLLGVAHPPGYALFTLLAKLFSLLPVGEVAWRLNLMGAVTGAATLLVVGRTARQVGRSPWAGLAAAGALGVSTTFWAQSTTVNIRALTVLWTALCCYFLAQFVCAPAGTREGTQALTALAASFGFGVSHHASLAFFAPLFGAIALWHDRRILSGFPSERYRLWLRCLLAFLLPFLFNLYVVVRASTGAPFGTAELVDAGRVVDHLLGKGFSGDMFAYLRWDRLLWERFLVVGNILHFQFGGPLLATSAVGLAWLARRRVKMAALLGGMVAIMAFIVATYRAPQSVEYFMPAYVPIALGVGSAVAAAEVGLGRWGSGQLASRSLLVGVLLAPVLLLGWAHWPSYAQLHGDRSARTYAESVLLDAPQDAHILSNWHWYTPLMYLQLVEGMRPDVQVTYLYPQGATEMPQAWAGRIERELGGVPLRVAPRLRGDPEGSERPLIVTNYYPTYANLPYRFEPVGGAFRVRAGPSWDLPPGLEPLGVELALDPPQVATVRPPQLRVLGYRVSYPQAVRPGDSISVELAWQPLQPLDQPYSTFVHLVGQEDVPLGQRDQRHERATTYQPGEVLVDRFEFPVFLSAAPGTYTLVAGAYVTAGESWQRLTTDDGRDAVSLATMAVVPDPLRPVTQHGLHHPFSGGPALVGVDYDDTLPDGRRVYLHWQLAGPPATAWLHVDGRPAAQARVPGGELGGYATTALDVPPGGEALSVTLWEAEGERQLSSRGAWGIGRQGAVPLPRPPSRAHYLPFGGQVALVGVGAAPRWEAGSPARVDLALLALHPIVADYVVSVGIRGAASHNDDGVPALGAIPTFKWIRGSQVRDPHSIPIPPETDGEVTLTLGLYDAFTTQGVPAMDERIARLGLANVPLAHVSIEQRPGGK